MNYFELYPGDYLRDTSRLTLLQHGVYLRLLMAYYSEESPLPADESELHVIVAAVTAADKAAVKRVSDRFFPVGQDGLRRNARADEEIVKARKRIETARLNGSKNKPAKNPPGYPTAYPEGEPEDTRRHTHSGEALHAPRATDSVGNSTQAPEALQEPTAAGRACLLIRKAGCIQTNPSHPDLLAALAEGVTPEVLADTVREAIAAGVRKPFAWSIATARSRHAAGASIVRKSDRPQQEQPRSGTHKLYVRENRPKRDPNLGAPQAFSELAASLGIAKDVAA